MRFLESMSRFSDNEGLYLKEFFESLTDQAYTWYASLKPGALRNWTHLVSLFKGKFFYTEDRFTLAELGRTKQHSKEDHDVYVR